MTTRRRAPTVLFGCGSTGAIGLLLLIAGAVWLIPRITKEVETWSQDLRVMEQAYEAWQPPPKGTGSDRLFPQRVGTFKRTGHSRSAVADLGIDTPGQRATYQSGQGTIELFVYQVTQLEKEALFHRVADSVENMSANYKSQIGSPESDRYVYTVGPPHQKGVLWWKKGWMFLVRARDSETPEAFLRSYLEAIDSRAKVKTRGR